MKNIAIIPARGGSKRIQKKNIKYFNGQPIIGYVIEKALGCKIFDNVFVSTDSIDVGEVAKSFGAEIPLASANRLTSLYHFDFPTSPVLFLCTIREYSLVCIFVG